MESGKMLENYGKGNNSKAKLIALCVKAVTGVIGTSMILEQSHPYLTIAVLAIGAITNEVINFYKWK